MLNTKIWVNIFRNILDYNILYLALHKTARITAIFGLLEREKKNVR